MKRKMMMAGLLVAILVAWALPALAAYTAELRFGNRIKVGSFKDFETITVLNPKVDFTDQEPVVCLVKVRGISGVQTLKQRLEVLQGETVVVTKELAQQNINGQQWAGYALFELMGQMAPGSYTFALSTSVDGGGYIVDTSQLITVKNTAGKVECLNVAIGTNLSTSAIDPWQWTVQPKAQLITSDYLFLTLCMKNIRGVQSYQSRLRILQETKVLRTLPAVSLSPNGQVWESAHIFFEIGKMKPGTYTFLVEYKAGGALTWVKLNEVTKTIQ